MKNRYVVSGQVYVVDHDAKTVELFENGRLRRTGGQYDSFMQVIRRKRIKPQPHSGFNFRDEAEELQWKRAIGEA